MLTSSNYKFWCVIITTCSLTHIGKSKELDYVRKISAWGDKWFKYPVMNIELIVKPISVVNMIYCNNENGYFAPLRCHRIISTSSVVTNEVSKLLWLNFLMIFFSTFKQWLIVLILQAYKNKLRYFLRSLYSCSGVCLTCVCGYYIS